MDERRAEVRRGTGESRDTCTCTPRPGQAKAGWTARAGRERARGAARRFVGFVIVAAIAGASAAAQDEAPEADSPRPPSGVVQAIVQGSTGGLAPEPGTPPPLPLEVSLEPKSARGTVDHPATPRRRSDQAPVMRAISFDEGEATVDVEGRTEVLRPGSRLGDDVVKSVSPGRLVLLRPEEVDGERHEALVLVTFDTAGVAKTQVFWTHDPSAPRAAEVTEP